MHLAAMLIGSRWVRATAASLLWVICLAHAVPAQTPTPEPAPKFDVVDSPITAEELAKELGYKFYGNTWKFSVPTHVRVREWDAEGSAADVPERPPKDAKWEDVYSPDKPQTEITVHVLEKTDKQPKPADGPDDFKRIELNFSINASGKDAADGQPPAAVTPAPGGVALKWNTSGGAGTSVSLDLTQGRHQGLNTEWLHFTGDLGNMVAGIGKAIGDAAAHPDRPGQQEAAEATVRDNVEAGMRNAPLDVCYFKGEVRGQSETERQKPVPRSYDVTRERAVCLVTLECSREPFKDDAAASTSSNGKQVASGH